MQENDKYLTFVEVVNQAKKTKLIRVESRRSGDLLGRIMWYGAWRQYCFYPQPGTIFNRGCMETINEELKRLMDERRK